MSDKSHVSMEQKVCQVCGVTYDSGAILFDTRFANRKLRQSMDKYTITGWGLCEEHQRLLNEGYIAFVECNNTGNHKRLQPVEADRTGQIMHIRRTVANKIMNTKLPEASPLVFVEIGVIDKIQAMQEKSE